MNMFLREMKAHRTGLIWWSLGMVALVASGMAKYAAYETAGQSIVAIFETLPKAVLVVFGMQGFDLTKASGFYGVLFLYVGVMAAIHATLLGASLIATEERDRTSEFLYTKPVSRTRAVSVSRWSEESGTGDANGRGIGSIPAAGGIRRGRSLRRQSYHCPAHWQRIKETVI